MLRLSGVFGSFRRGLFESRFFAQRKIVELRSSPESVETLRPFEQADPYSRPDESVAARTYSKKLILPLEEAE